MGKTFRVSDINTAAFLSLSGLTFSFEKKGKRVFFCFTAGPDVYKKLEEFNTGAKVDVAEYSRELRRLKAQMYELKNSGDGNGE
jgi:hypothetical protein